MATFMVRSGSPPVPSCHRRSGSSTAKTSQSKHTQKIPKEQAESDMVNTTCTVPQSLSFPSLEVCRFHHKEEKKRWSIVAIIGGKSLTSDSPSSSDLPSEESEPDRHQGSSSHAKPSCLFRSILRRCSTNCQNPPPRRRHQTDDMHSWSQLHRSKTFLKTKKKLKKDIFKCPGKKKASV